MALKEIAGPRADWSVLRRSGLLCKTLFWIWNFRGHSTENHCRQTLFHSIRFHSIPFNSIRFNSVRFDSILFGLVKPRCVHCRQQKIRHTEKAKEHETNSRSTSIKHNSNSNGIFISAVFQAFSLFD